MADAPDKGKAIPIPCPECGTKAKVPIAKITEKGLIYSCPKCKTKIRAAKEKNKVNVRRASAVEVAAMVKEEEVEEKPLKPLVIELTPPWITTFADLSTLLLTFFVLMLSFANMDVVKYKDLAGSVAERYGVTMLDRGSYQTVSSGTFMDVDSNIEATGPAVKRDQLVNEIYDTVVREGFRGAASITTTDEGVRVRVKGRALFEPGNSKLLPESLKLLDGLVGLMNQTKDLMMFVEGHTDNERARSRKFPSNWELSVLRATSVLEYIISKGGPPERMATVGFADTMPLFPNDKPETKILNRRVEFLFKRL